MKIACITPDQKHDYLCATILEGLKLSTHVRELCCTDPGNGAYRILNDAGFVRYAQKADLILAFFGKVRGNRSPKYALLDEINAWDKVAYIDGSEWTCSAYPDSPMQVQEALFNVARRRGTPWLHPWFFERAHWYFKRECYPEDQRQGVIPLPFGLIQEDIRFGHQERDIDILCAFGQQDNGLRKEIMNLVRSLSENYRVMAGSFPKEKYKELLTRSRIVCDAWGGGDCNARFFEILGSQSCLFYQKWNIIQPNPLVDFVHAVSYESIEQAKERLLSLLQRPEMIEQLRLNGHHHALRYHTSLARAENILKTVGLLQ